MDRPFIGSHHLRLQRTGDYVSRCRCGALVARDFGALPLSFEPNRGQTDSQVAYLARGSGYTLFLAPTSAVFEFQRGASAQRHPSETAVIRMDLVGANAQAHMSGQQSLPGSANYLLGDDRSKWSTDLPTFASTATGGVYPGIDLVYYGTQGQLEYDFVVAPRAEPARIRLAFAGAHPHLAPSGDLILSVAGTTGQNDIRFRKPVLYQQVDGVRQPVSGNFTVGAHQQVGVQVGVYDHRRELVIDPQLVYSSYLGGSTQVSVPYGMALNSAGEIYLTGITYAVDYPTTPGVLFPHCPASTPNIDTKCGASSLSAAFVSKISADGKTLIYSTYLGGSGGGTGIGGVGSGADYGVAVAVGANDEAWVLGGTNSNNFPITADAYLKFCSPSVAGFDFNTNLYFGEKSGCAGFNGGQEYIYGSTSAFIVKLNPTGTSILYGTFLGSTGNTFPAAITLDSAGNVYVTGAVTTGQVGPVPQSGQYVFPTTASAYLAPVENSTNAFVTELSADGHTLLYSTTFGGAANSDTNYVSGLTLANGKIVIGGASRSPSMPTTAGALGTTCAQNTPTQCNEVNAFIAEFDPTKSGAASLVFSTFLNGAGAGNISQVYALASDSSGNLYAIGNDQFPDFPITAGALQPTCFLHSTNCNTYFVTKLSSTGALVWSTFYGSPSGAMGFASYPLQITADAYRNVYIAGYPDNAGDLPLNGSPVPYQSGSAFLAELSSSGSQVLFGTFFGAPGNDGAINVTGLSVDALGDMVFAGYTNSSKLPLANALQSTDGGGFNEGYFAKISNLPTYNANSGQLSIPSLAIGNAIYSNAVVTVAKILTPPNGTAPIGTEPTYNTVTKQLSIPAVVVGNTTFYNVVVSVGKLLSLGNVAGADTFSGNQLTMPVVQEGATTFNNVIVTVGGVVQLAGGMPLGIKDQYNSTTHQMTVRAVQVGTKAYTNVTVTVTSLVSVGGGPP